MLLSKFTPAETLLIRHGTSATVRQILKYTFMDLLLKQAIMIETVEKQPHRRDPFATYRYVSRGSKYKEIEGLPHEQPFLKPLVENPHRRMLFRNCVQVAYENAGSQYALHRNIMKSPALDGAFSVSLLDNIFSRYTYSAKGLEYRTSVEQEINELEKTLPGPLTVHKQKSLEIITQIRGNIFLIQGVDLSILKEIDEAFTRDFTKEVTDTTGLSCGTWIDVHTYGGDFGSSCSGDSTGSSGCSSGDSGCGGGCGGCGGD